eukprot:6889975-Prymnesium_polylepis.1
MQKSELRAFIVRAEAVAELTARYCILLNLDFVVGFSSSPRRKALCPSGQAGTYPLVGGCACA